MNQLNHFIPWISAIFIFIFFEEIIQFPQTILFLAPIALLLTVLTVWQLTGREVKLNKFWRYLITPVLFLSGGLLFLSFLEGHLIKQLFLIGFAILLWAYFQIIFLRFHFRPKYEPYSLENVTVHLNLITIYLTAAGFYSLIVFLNVNFWLLGGLFILISLIMAYQVVWASSTTARVGWPYLVTIGLITSQTYLVVSYLPTSIHVNGLLVALSFYLSSGLSRNWLLEIKDKNVIYRYSFISVISMIIILLTAKWF